MSALAVCRVAPSSPLTPAQELVATLLGLGLDYGEAAVELKVKPITVRFHTQRIAAKLPGDLPVQARVAAWARGASYDVLTGAELRVKVGLPPLCESGGGVLTPVTSPAPLARVFASPEP